MGMVVTVNCDGEKSRSGGSGPAGTKRRSQVMGRRSQVTENLIKKLDTPLGFSCLFIVSFLVTPQPGICLPSTMLPGFVLRVKH